MSIRWTETASSQLAAIRDYIARSSPSYAQALAGRIVRRAKRLNSQPRLGAMVPDYDDESIREVYEHPYRIIYRIDGDDVQFLAVIHSARQLPSDSLG